MIKVEISGDKELLAHLDAMPGNVHNAVLRKMTSLALQLETYVKQNKLAGQVLQKISGRLQSSIQNDVIDSADIIEARVYSNTSAAPYNAAQEYGAVIPDRYPVNAKAMHFFVGGKEVFAKFAKGFTLKERSYMRSSLADNRQLIIDGIAQAAIAGAKQ